MKKPSYFTLIIVALITFQLGVSAFRDVAVWYSFSDKYDVISAKQTLAYINAKEAEFYTDSQAAQYGGISELCRNNFDPKLCTNAESPFHQGYQFNVYLYQENGVSYYAIQAFPISSLMKTVLNIPQKPTLIYDSLTKQISETQVSSGLRMFSSEVCRYGE